MFLSLPSAPRLAAILSREHLLTRLALFLPLLVLAGVALLGESLVRADRDNARREQRHAVATELGALRTRLESQLNAALNLSQGLLAYVTGEGRLDVPTLEPLVRTLHDHSPLLRGIAIAPGNRIAYVYPPDGNEAAIGIYYPEMPAQWPDVRRAIEQGRPRLTPPLRLRDGRNALLYRVPVFIGERRDYWGLLSMVIDLERLADTVGQVAAKQQLQLAMRSHDEASGRNAAILGDPALFEADSIRVDLWGTGVHWELAARPTAGWDRDGGFALKRSLAWALAALLAASTWQLLAFAARRAELARTLAAARDAAEAANAAKDRFVATMSHELQAPMRSILASGQMLQVDAGLNPHQQATVGDLLRAGRTLDRLIGELVDMARIDAGELELAIEPLSLAEVLSECEAQARPLAARRRITLAIDRGVGTMVLGDRGRLSRVLFELLAHAIRNGRDDGRIELRVGFADGQRASIELRDDGPGLSAEQLARLFEPVERRGGEGNRDALPGLWIARWLLERMGGEIDASSEVEAGTRFRIRLPLPGHDESGARPAPLGPGAVSR